MVVQNRGNAQLTLTYSRLSGTNEITVFRAPAVLAAGESVSMKIRLIPASAGTKAATYRISSNDPDTPNIDLSALGNGIQLQPPSTGDWQVVRSIQLSGANPGYIAISRGKAYVTRGGSGLTTVDLSSGVELANITFSAFPGKFPGHVSVFGNRVYVPLSDCCGNGQLAVVDADSGTLSAYVPGGKSVQHSRVQWQSLRRR